MAMHIGQRFLDDSEQARLHISTETASRLIEFESQLQPATFRESLGIPPHGGQKPALVEQRGMQQMGHGSHLADRLLQEIFRVSETGLAVCWQGLGRRTCLR